MAIANTGSFNPGGLSFTPSLEIPEFDSRPLGRAVTLMSEIDKERTSRVGENIEDYATTRDSLGATFVNPKNAELYDLERKRYGLSDNDLQISDEDIKDGYAVRQLTAKASKFAASPLVKQALEDDIVGQAFGNLYRNIPNEKMRSLAQTRYDDFKSGMISGKDLDLEDYKVVDHTEDLLENMRKYAPERQYSRMEKDGTEVKFYARDQQAVANVADLVMSDPKYRNMVDAGLLTRETIEGDLTRSGAFQERITDYQRPPATKTGKAALSASDKAREGLSITQRSGLQRLEQATGNEELVFDDEVMSTILSAEKFATRAFEGRAQMLDQEVYQNAIGLIGVGKLGSLTPELSGIANEEFSNLFGNNSEELTADQWLELSKATDANSLEARRVARNRIMNKYTTEKGGVIEVSDEVKSLGMGLNASQLTRKVDDAIIDYINTKANPALPVSEGGEEAPEVTKPRTLLELQEKFTAGADMGSPLLTAIVAAENGGKMQWDNTYDGSSTGKRRPDLLKVPVSDLPDGTTIGPFQIQKATALDMVNKLGMDPSTTTLTPDVQRQIAGALMDRRGRKNFEAGMLSIEDYADNLSIEWRGLPYNTGKTYPDQYSNSNNANISRNQLINSIALSAPVKDYYGQSLQVAPQAFNALQRASEDFKAKYGEPIQIGSHEHNGVRSYEKQIQTYAQGRTRDQVKERLEKEGLSYTNSELDRILKASKEQGEYVVTWTIGGSDHLKGKAIDLIQTPTVTVAGTEMTNAEYRALVKPYLENSGFEFTMPTQGAKADPMHISYRPK